MEENQQEIVEESAIIRVGVVIEIPMKIRAKDDEEFVREIAADPEVGDALGHLLSSAILYRDSKKARAGHRIKYSKLVLFYDQETELPMQMGWSEI